MNSSLVSTLFNKILIKDIIKEIISYYPRYEKYITKEDYIKLITEMIQTKFNFVIDEPYEVRYYKNLYKLQHNTIPRGPKANSLIWLKSKVNIRLQNDIIEYKELTYKPRYVSRNHFKNKKNKCMARLWNDHYGGQCSNTQKIDELCMVHYNIKNKKGSLQFGRIDEPRPERDFFNNNKLNWKDI